MKERGLVLAAGALAMGLILGGLFGGRSVAQQAVAGGRYQYQCITKVEARMYKDEALAVFNKMGSEGWRLMENRLVNVGPNPMGGAAYSDVYCFERRY
jgi:hypothetical protein